MRASICLVHGGEEEIRFHETLTTASHERCIIDYQRHNVSHHFLTFKSR